MIKRIVQKDQSKIKIGEIIEILRRPCKRNEKSRLRAFARTQAKNKRFRLKTVCKNLLNR